MRYYVSAQQRGAESKKRQSAQHETKQTRAVPPKRLCGVRALARSYSSSCCCCIISKLTSRRLYWLQPDQDHMTTKLLTAAPVATRSEPYETVSCFALALVRTRSEYCNTTQAQDTTAQHDTPQHNTTQGQDHEDEDDDDMDEDHGDKDKDAKTHRESCKDKGRRRWWRGQGCPHGQQQRSGWIEMGMPLYSKGMRVASGCEWGLSLPKQWCGAGT